MEKNHQANSLRIHGFWLSLALAFHVFILVPGNLYLGNSEEFVTPLAAIYRTYSIPAVLLIIAFTGFGLIVPSRKRHLYVAMLAAIFVMMWVQAHLLVWELGLLNGQTIDWGNFALRNWIDGAIWVSIALLACRYARQIARKGVYVVYLLCLLQCVALLVAIVTADHSLVNQSQLAQAAAASDKTHRFSRKDNVLLIVMDGFQADVFDYMIREPRHGPFLQGALQGFVYYRDNMGAFPTTYMSVPAFTGERIYRNHMPQSEFVHETMARSSIMKAAYDAGYEVDLAAPANVLRHYIGAPHTNAFAINYDESRVMSIYREAAKLLDISLFRITPHFIKKWVYNEQKWRIEPLMTVESNYQFNFFLTATFLSTTTTALSVDRDSPVLKVLHLMGTHWPMVVDERCGLRDPPFTITRKSTTDQSRCSLIQLIDLFQSMQAHGIYDNAFIIVLADHGAQLPPLRFKPADVEGAVFVDPWIAAQATPMLAIKRPRDKGSLRVSEAPTSISDVPATINKEQRLGGVFANPSIFDLDEDTVRTRSFYAYPWTRADWTSDFATPIQEFLVEGSPYTGTWRLGREFKPPDNQ